MTGLLAKIFIVLLMVVSIANCAKRKAKAEVFQGALGYCGNEKLGDFDVVLNRSAKQPGLFELRIVTVGVNTPGGTFVRVALANENMEFVEKVEYVKIKKDRVLYEGLVSPQELELYTLIVIAPWKGGQSTFLSSLSGDDEAICRVPSTDTTQVGAAGSGNYTP